MTENQTEGNSKVRMLCTPVGRLRRVKNKRTVIHRMNVRPIWLDEAAQPEVALPPTIQRILADAIDIPCHTHTLSIVISKTPEVGGIA